MRIRCVIMVGLALLTGGIRIGLACDYEMTSSYPGGVYVCVDPSLFYTQGRPHTSGSGIAFRFNQAIRGVMAITYAGWSTLNPPSAWLRATAYYSDGTTEMVPCDNSAWEHKQDEAGNWYYSYYMTNWFSAPQGYVVTQLVMISMNSDANADVVGRFLIDTDGDKLRDSQEQVLGTNPNLWDTDGDGLSDGEEVRTATNPTNARSYFGISAVTNIAPGSVDFTFAWPSTNGKSYRIERFFSPVRPAWSIVQDGVPGTFPKNTLNVSASPSWTSCFFRVVQTNDRVTGRNAVGYIKATIPRGNLMMIQTPFENLNGSGRYVVGELLGSSLPRGTTAYIWNRDLQQYKSESFTTRWIPGTNTFSRGVGVYVKIPATASLNSYDIVMMGEVPDRITAPTSSMSIVRGLQMMGFMYPVAIPLTNIALATTAKRGDTIYYWKTNQSWGSEGFVTRWIPGTFVLEPGQACYYETTNATVWTETKPYTWP
jgi:hypothetical protein